MFRGASLSRWPKPTPPSAAHVLYLVGAMVFKIEHFQNVPLWKTKRGPLISGRYGKVASTGCPQFTLPRAREL
jgi:hypothetical protein